MPSQSLKQWNGTAATALDRMEVAHRAVGGTGRGRRYATQQINQSYVVLVSSHFQQFCRNLHTEAAVHITNAIDPLLRPIVMSAFAEGRKLDRGNPTKGNIGADFGRLGMRFWPEVEKWRPSNKKRAKKLDNMGNWRNAIAHQDFAGNADELDNRSEITLPEVRAFRVVCNQLSRDFDVVVLAHIKGVAGSNAGW